MHTIGDNVLEQAKKIKESGGTSTLEGLDFLGLSRDSENYPAGNIYLSALSIINKLLDEVEELKKKN